MAGEPDTQLDKALRALLLVNLGSMKQKQQIAILDQDGFGQSEIAEVVGSTPKGRQRAARGNQEREAEES